MSDPALKRTVVVANQQGMHARAAVMVVTEARKHKARIIITKGTHQVEATDVLAGDVAGRGPGGGVAAGGFRRAGPQDALDAMEQLFLAQVRRRLIRDAEATRNCRFARALPSAKRWSWTTRDFASLAGSWRATRWTMSWSGSTRRSRPRRPKSPAIARRLPASWARNTPPSSRPTCRCSRTPGCAANWRR